MPSKKVPWLKLSKKSDLELAERPPIWLGNRSHGEYDQPQTRDERLIHELTMKRAADGDGTTMLSPADIAAAGGGSTGAAGGGGAGMPAAGSGVTGMAGRGAAGMGASGSPAAGMGGTPAMMPAYESIGVREIQRITPCRR